MICGQSASLHGIHAKKKFTTFPREPWCFLLKCLLNPAPREIFDALGRNTFLKMLDVRCMHVKSSQHSSDLALRDLVDRRWVKRKTKPLLWSITAKKTCSRQLCLGICLQNTESYIKKIPSLLHQIFAMWKTPRNKELIGRKYICDKF